jgi:hypothetical protein
MYKVPWATVQMYLLDRTKLKRKKGGKEVVTYDSQDEELEGLNSLIPK